MPRSADVSQDTLVFTRTFTVVLIVNLLVFAFVVVHSSPPGRAPLAVAALVSRVACR